MATFTEIITIPTIAAIVYTIIDIIKTAVDGDEKFKRFIPLASALLGAICGAVCFFVAPEVIGASNIVIAIVIGAASGLSATGANQAVKQLTKKGDDNELQG